MITVPEPAFDANGLVSVVVQDRVTGDVLMLAHANREALERTAETGLAHFWSRRRRRLWRKGETSGHVMRVVEVRADCDLDALLMLVEPSGPACHSGARTCFGDTSPTHVGVIGELERVIAERDRERPLGSYTARLLAGGLEQSLKKVREESTEVVLAAEGESDERLAEESADLLFHLLVTWHQRGLSFGRALEVLKRRRQGK